MGILSKTSHCPVIYNSHKLRDPESLKDLEGEKELNRKRFYVYIILVEWALRKIDFLKNCTV